MEVNCILFAHELRYHEDKLDNIGNHLLLLFYRFTLALEKYKVVITTKIYAL